MPCCAICHQEKEAGYRINPETGRLETDRFWCDDDYEASASRAAREKHDSAPPTLRRGRNPS